MELLQKAGLLRELLESYEDDSSLIETICQYQGLSITDLENKLRQLLKLESCKHSISDYLLRSKRLYSCNQELSNHELSDLLQLAEYLILPSEIRFKLKVELNLPESLKKIVPDNLEINPDSLDFWIVTSTADPDELKTVKQVVKAETLIPDWSYILATMHNNLEALRILCDQGQRLPDNCLDIACKVDNLDLVEFIYNKIASNPPYFISTPTMCHSQECRQFFLKKGFYCSPSDLFFALAYGDLKYIEYLEKQGLEWSTFTICADEMMFRAVQTGKKDIIDHIYHIFKDNHLIWNVVQRSPGNCLETLKYIHELGCPWSEETPIAACLTGNLKVLKYLHETGCPWNYERLCEAAGSSQCIEYLDSYVSC